MRIIAVVFTLLFPLILFGQSDSIEIKYDTVRVKKDPVFVTKKVFYAGQPQNKVKKNSIGVGLTVAQVKSFFYTCPECEIYQPYANKMDSVQKDKYSLGMHLAWYRNISKKTILESRLEWLGLREEFNYDSIYLNKYKQVAINLTWYYKIFNKKKFNAGIGVGAGLNYLINARGKTLSIFQTEELTEMNEFRKFNKFMGTAQLNSIFSYSISDRTNLILSPSVSFEYNPLTSYKEYYLHYRLYYRFNATVSRNF